MQRSNKENDKEKKGGGIVGWIIFAIVILTSAGDAFEAIWPLLLTAIVFAAFIGAMYYAVKKVNGKGKSSQDRSEAVYADSGTKPHHAPSLSKILTQSAKEEELENCDDEHYISASPEERRKLQLSQFYKSGVISREEYRMMRERWKV